MKPETFTAKEDLKTLIEQKLALAAMQTEIIEAIKQNPDVSKDDLWCIAYKHLKSSDTSKEDQTKTFMIIEKYVTRHEAVKSAREKFPIDSDLFSYLFNQRPHGKIEIKTGPIVIYIRCDDQQDFNLAFRDDPSFSEDLTPTQLHHARLASGKFLMTARQPELAGTLIIENGVLVNKGGEISEKNFIHEEQHAIKNLFEDKEREADFTGQEDIYDKELASKMVENYLRIYRKNNMEPLAKHEILAYMKTGKSSKETYEELTLPQKDGGIYDYAESHIPYLKDHAGSWKPIFQEALTDELLRKIFEDEYWRVVASGCHAFDKLIEKVRLSEQDTINLLTVEPLSKWKKLAERIVEYAKE